MGMFQKKERKIELSELLVTENLPRLIPDTKSQIQESQENTKQGNAKKHLCPSLNYRNAKEKKTSRGKTPTSMGTK